MCWLTLQGLLGLMDYSKVMEGGDGAWEKKAWEISDSDHQVRSLRNDSALPWAHSVLVGRQHCLCSSPAACGAEMTLTAWFPRVLRGSSNHDLENEWGQMDEPSTNMFTLNGQLFNMDLLLLAVSADISDAGLSCCYSECFAHLIINGSTTLCTDFFVTGT